MTRIYFKLILCIITFTGLAAGLSPLLGRLRPSNPVLDGIHNGCEGQPQPCWYGIRPGVTPIADALQTVRHTDFVKLTVNDYIAIVVYRSNTMRCGVELRIKRGLVDTVTIINCLDKQMGDVVRSMRNANHQLPFSMGMLDTTMGEEITESFNNYQPCLGYTPYGQIIGMPLGKAGDALTPPTSNWNDFLPFGWYVHAGGSLSCDLVESTTKLS